MPTPEQQLFSEIKKLHEKRQETLKFSIENDTPDNQKYLEEEKRLAEETKKKIEELRGRLWTFEKELSRSELQKQYQAQKEIFQTNHLLETLSTGEIGIKGIDQKEYSFPTLEQIQKELQKNPELKIKMKQEFVEINITPFALPLSRLTGTISQAVLRHKKEGKLFATKKDQNDPDESLELDEIQPLWISDEYQDADINNSLVYFPKQFDQTNHQGKTKTEILNLKTAFPGYLITLQEKNLNIPAKKQGQTRNNRKQIEAGKTPEEYLQKLQTEKQYQNETGIVPEEWLTRFLIHLEKTNQVIDDYEGNGKINYNLAGYLAASGAVSSADWDRSDRQAFLVRYDSGNRDSGIGARSAVRVGIGV